MNIYVWLITGKSPLMQSNPVEFIEKENGDQSGLKIKKKVYIDTEEAKKRLYIVDNNYCHPAAAFRRGLITATTGRKYGKTAARNVIAAGVLPAEDFLVICDKKGAPAKKYDLDVRSVIIGKARIKRVRPKFMKWSLKLPLEIDEELISTEQVTEALNLMGRLCGIGEFRPDPSNGKSGVGTFGRFSVELIN